MLVLGCIKADVCKLSFCRFRDPISRFAELRIILEHFSEFHWISKKNCKSVIWEHKCLPVGVCRHRSFGSTSRHHVNIAALHRIIAWHHIVAVVWNWSQVMNDSARHENLLAATDLEAVRLRGSSKRANARKRNQQSENGPKNENDQKSHVFTTVWIDQSAQTWSLGQHRQPR